MAGILSLKYAKVRIIFVPETISGIWNFYKINHSTENYGDLLDIKKRRVCLSITNNFVVGHSFCLNPEPWDIE